MPPEERRGYVRQTEQIYAAGEREPGDAVESGEDPGELRFVDREVRGDGALETLGFEEGGVRWGAGLHGVRGVRGDAAVGEAGDRLAD